MSWNFLCNSTQADLKFTFYDSIYLVPEQAWNHVLQGKNIYLELDYLKAMEKSLEGEMEFRYVVFYCQENTPVAIAANQVVNFTSEKFEDQFPKGIQSVQAKLLKHLSLKVLVCGNLFATGQNGFAFIDELDPEMAYRNLCVAMYKLRRSENFEDSPINLILMKEFWPESTTHLEVLKDNGYRNFQIDVNMVLKMHPDWKTFEDYMSSMVSKFRTKAKSVMKRSSALSVQEFGMPELEEHKNHMFELYKNVTEQADFNFASLNAESFLGLKKALDDKFNVTGYFVDNQLVGFKTAFITGQFVDANYVGLDYTKNQDYSVYQRMLYDLVKLTIENGGKELRLGRTAEQIKSCLGAEPIHMDLLLKHKNTLSNQLIKPLIDSVSPSEFELRNPFKADFKLA